MEQFYFHVSRNGIRKQDRAGLPFGNKQAACAAAFEKMYRLLRDPQHRNMYVTTEVCDATHTLFVVRGSILVEERNGQLF